MESYAKKTVETLIEKNLTVATAESCTGGLLSAKITSISGSSAIISFSMVTYSNDVKIENLEVDRETIEKFGAVSKQTAEQMAENIRKKADADIGVGITGVAGPNMSEDKPVGLVFVAIATNKKTITHKLELKNLTREQVREQAAETALKLVHETALSHPKGEPDATN